MYKIKTLWRMILNLCGEVAEPHQRPQQGEHRGCAEVQSEWWPCLFRGCPGRISLPRWVPDVARGAGVFRSGTEEPWEPAVKLLWLAWRLFSPFQIGEGWVAICCLSESFVCPPSYLISFNPGSPEPFSPFPLLGDNNTAFHLDPPIPLLPISHTVYSSGTHGHGTLKSFHTLSSTKGIKCVLN